MSCIVDNAAIYIMVVKFRNTTWPPPPQLSLHRRASLSSYSNGTRSYIAERIQNAVYIVRCLWYRMGPCSNKHTGEIFLWHLSLLLYTFPKSYEQFHALTWTVRRVPPISLTALWWNCLCFRRQSFLLFWNRIKVVLPFDTRYSIKKFFSPFSHWKMYITVQYTVLFIEE
jgi:hypothetical protein